MSEAQPPRSRRELREQRAASEPRPQDGIDDEAAAPEDEPRSRSARRPRGGVIGVLRALGTGLLAGVLLLVIAIGVLAIAVPAVTGSTALTVMTSSMEPSLPPGTMVVVKPLDPAEIQPGDVVTYQLRSGESVLVTHRVTQRLLTADGELLFITQGDNNPSADPDPIQAVQIRGKVWYAIPFVGWVSTVLTGELRVILIPVAVGLLLAYAAWMLLSGIREKRRGRRASSDVNPGKGPDISD